MPAYALYTQYIAYIKYMHESSNPILKHIQC